jgi:hypothetical protein
LAKVQLPVGHHELAGAVPARQLAAAMAEALIKAFFFKD